MSTVFVLEPIGTGLLLELPKGLSAWWIVWIAASAAAGVLALALATQGFARQRLGAVERAACLAAGIMLMFPAIVDQWVGGRVMARLIGIGLLALVIVRQGWLARR